MSHRNPLPPLRGRSLRTTAIALAVTAALVTPSYAGFLEDFYSQAGGGSNITAPGVMQTQSLSIVSGGGFMLRAPSRNFIPFHVTPPSIKAGCGGIDAYLGSFSMANKDQFIAFLRNIGQNAAGLAFKVALNAISPDLNAQMQQIADYLNQQTRQLQNSCALANQAIDSSGTSGYIKDTVTDAKKWVLATGSASDAAAGDEMVKANGQVAIDNSPPLTKDDGTMAEGVETNILWDALGQARQLDPSGNDLTAEEKGMIMALLGTTVIARDTDPRATGADAALSPVPWAPIIQMQDIVGQVDSDDFVSIYSCSDPCLTLAKASSSTRPLARQVNTSALNLRTKIQSRQMPDYGDLALLSKSSIPIYKVISMLAQNTYAYAAMADQLIPQYSEAIAIEMAAEFVHHAMQIATKALEVAIQKSKRPSYSIERDRLIARARTITDQARQLSMAVHVKLQAKAATMETLEQLQRALYGQMGSQLAANMRTRRR